MFKAHEVMEEAIPRGEAEMIAEILGVSLSSVQRWRRAPETEEDKTTGRRSPLDALLLLINAVFARYPPGADKIADRVVGEVERLKAIHGHAETVPLEKIEDEIRDMQRTLGRFANSVARANGNERV